MTLVERNQTFFQKHHKFLAAILAVALPYAGFNGIQQARQAMAPPTAGDTNIAITTSGGLSQIDVQVLIDKALGAHQDSKKYHEFHR